MIFSLRKIDLSNNRTQYWIGVIINLIFISILYCFPTSYANLQVPIGIYQTNCWNCSDVTTYVQPAENFLKYGVFGKGYVPDYFRTIGYPALISFFKAIAGTKWLTLLQVFQCFIFAFIYPLISEIVRILSSEKTEKIVQFTFISLLLTGAYYTRSAMVLTDMLFLVFFTAGFYLGLMLYKHFTAKRLLLYITIISLTGLIRPTLSIFPLLNIALAYFIAKKESLSIKNSLLKSLGVSILLYLVIQLPAYRNYINHRYFEASSVIGVNAFEYLTKKIYIAENNTVEFEKLKNNIDTISSISAKTQARKKAMFKTVVAHPITTAKVLAINSINVCLSNNLCSNIGNYFGYDWKLFKGSCYTYTVSPILKITSYLLMVFYAILWAIFGLKLVEMIQTKKFELLVIVLILGVMFMIPGILTGDGGSRFRLPFEHILFIFAFSYYLEKIAPRLTKAKKEAVQN
jgi:hypothetical protein